MRHPRNWLYELPIASRNVARCLNADIGCSVTVAASERCVIHVRTVMRQSLPPRDVEHREINTDFLFV